MKEYDKGDAVQCVASFKNRAGAFIDPTTVKFYYRHSSVEPANATVLTYGVDAALVRDSLGNFHVDVDANLPGVWYTRWESTGTGQAADEGEFKVLASKFS